MLLYSLEVQHLVVLETTNSKVKNHAQTDAADDGCTSPSMAHVETAELFGGAEWSLAQLSFFHGSSLYHEMPG